MSNKKVVIIGLGLIGGSIARALKKAGFCVAGIDVDNDRLKRALFENVIDEMLNIKTVADDCETFSILNGAQTIFLSLPASDVLPVVNIISKYIPENTVVTDTCSIKKKMVKEMHRILPRRVDFVGGHPMAGSERSGYEYSREDLFYGAPYVVTPTHITDAEAIWSVVKLIMEIGARPVIMSPEQHDTIVAAVSHLPQIVSTTLVNTLKAVYPDGNVLYLAGGGWRDTTRIARSGSGMWKDILALNKDDVLPLISEFKRQLSAMENSIRRDDSSGIGLMFNCAKDYLSNNCQFSAPSSEERCKK
jgi:prephenate dehydrogenase